MDLKFCFLHFPEIAGFSSTIQIYNKALSKTLNYFYHSEEITGLTWFQSYWVSASADKSIKFCQVSWETLTASLCFELTHKKKISAICSNSNFLFFSDKTGEIWRVESQNLQSGLTEVLANCQFFVGHQASVTYLWCDEDYLISADQEHKIKVTRISPYGQIENILLGHTSSIISSVYFNQKIISCDENGVLFVWSSSSSFSSVKLNEAVRLSVFKDRVIGVAEKASYLVDIEFLQVVPLCSFAVLAEYPFVFVKNKDFEETKLEFNLDY